MYIQFCFPSFEELKRGSGASMAWNGKGTDPIFIDCFRRRNAT